MVSQQDAASAMSAMAAVNLVGKLAAGGFVWLSIDAEEEGGGGGGGLWLAYDT